MIFIASLCSQEKARSIKALSFTEQDVAKCLVVKDGLLTSFRDQNLAAVALDRCGDFKENHSTFASHISVDTIVEAFETFVRIGDHAPSAKAMTTFVLAKRSTLAGARNDPEGKGFLPNSTRLKPIFCRVGLWWTNPEEEDRARTWGRQMVQIVSRDDPDGIRGLGTNLRKNLNMGEIYPPEKLEKIKEFKKVWDPSNLFWNPVVDGW